MNRRSFIGAAGFGIFAVASSSCTGRADDQARALARPELLSALGSGPVGVIGVRYRAANPSESDAPSLRRAIIASLPLRARFFQSTSVSLQQQVRADFAEGRTVVVDGWILSVTEARQCAIFSLIPA
jgi:hypothetical protein